MPYRPGVHNAVACRYCGGKYFGRSLEFHLVKCAEKQSRVELPCPHCDGLVRRDELGQHLKGCRAMQGGKKSAGKRTGDAAAGAGVDGGMGRQAAFSAEEYAIHGTEGGLLPCAVCGRTFAPDRLGKHQSACRNASAQRRPVFDVSAQRVRGTDLEEFHRGGGRGNSHSSNSRGRGTRGASSRAAASRSSRIGSSSTGNNSSSSGSQSSHRQTGSQGGGEVPKWKRDHEALVRNVRAARQAARHIAAGGDVRDLPPPPPSEEDPSFVPCPHCSRTFAPDTAARHIPKCATTFNRPKPPPRVRGAMESSPGHHESRMSTSLDHGMSPRTRRVSSNPRTPNSAPPKRRPGSSSSASASASRLNAALRSSGGGVREPRPVYRPESSASFTAITESNTQRNASLASTAPGIGGRGVGRNQREPRREVMSRTVNDTSGRGSGGYAQSPGKGGTGRNVSFDAMVHYDTGDSGRVNLASRASKTLPQRGGAGNTPRSKGPVRGIASAGPRRSSAMPTKESIERLEAATTGGDGSFDGLRTITRRSLSATTRPRYAAAVSAGWANDDEPRLQRETYTNSNSDRNGSRRGINSGSNSNNGPRGFSARGTSVMPAGASDFQRQSQTFGDSPHYGVATFPTVGARSGSRQSRRNLIDPQVAYGGYEDRQRQRQERARALREQRTAAGEAVF